MALLANVFQLQELREELSEDIRKRRATSTTILVGMGTCGIAAGAQETMQALESELTKRGIDAQLSPVGCLGVCSKEPLVDISQASNNHVLYANITAEMVPRLVEEHLVHGRPVKSWVLGRMAVDE